MCVWCVVCGVWCVCKFHFPKRMITFCKLVMMNSITEKDKIIHHV